MSTAKTLISILAINAIWVGVTLLNKQSAAQRECPPPPPPVVMYNCSRAMQAVELTLSITDTCIELLERTRAELKTAQPEEG